MNFQGMLVFFHECEQPNNVAFCKAYHHGCFGPYKSCLIACAHSKCISQGLISFWNSETRHAYGTGTKYTCQAELVVFRSSSCAAPRPDRAEEALGAGYKIFFWWHHMPIYANLCRYMPIYADICRYMPNYDMAYPGCPAAFSGRSFLYNRKNS